MQTQVLCHQKGDVGEHGNQRSVGGKIQSEEGSGKMMATQGHLGAFKICPAKGFSCSSGIAPAALPLLVLCLVGATQVLCPTYRMTIRTSRTEFTRYVGT